MHWIESHQSLARHPKMFRLAALLKTSAPQVIGHLHLFWWWAVDYAPDGDLSGFSEIEIAAGAMWTKAPEIFVAALITAGFIDDDRHIHDWAMYAGKALVKRVKERDRSRENRRKNKAGVQTDTQSPNACVQCTPDVRTAIDEEPVHVRTLLQTDSTDSTDRQTVQTDSTDRTRGSPADCPKPDATPRSPSTGPGALTEDLPLGFPKSEAEAVQACLGKYPPEFIVNVYNRAVSRGGCDARGWPIKSWVHHVATYQKFAVAEKFEKPAGAPESAGSRMFRLREASKALKEAMDQHPGRPGGGCVASMRETYAKEFRDLEARYRAVQGEIVACGMGDLAQAAEKTES